jgi:hypothetical protein
MKRVHGSAGASAYLYRPSSVSHPLLGLALGRRSTYGAYLHFRRIVRDLARGRVPAADCVDNINKLVFDVAAWLSDEQQGQLSYEIDKLRCELFRVARDACDVMDPCLLEGLANATLMQQGLDVLWDNTETTLPRLVATKPALPYPRALENAVTQPNWSEAAKEWRAVVEAIDVLGVKVLKSWSRPQLQAAHRSLILFATFGRSNYLGADATQRQSWWRVKGMAHLRILQAHLGLEEAGSAAQRSLAQDLAREIQRQVDGGRVEVVSFELREAEFHAANSEDWHLVVLEPVTPSGSKEDAAELARFRPLTRPLPVATLPKLAELDEWESGLIDEFPWAREAIQEIFQSLRVRALFGVRQLHVPPILLVGPPGAGKSRLARRLAETFALPFHAISVGGVHDSKVLTGTARGWGGGCPSPLLQPLLACKSASALVLLDEIDKLGSNGGGSPPISNALLALLEPETASRFHDTFLQSALDLSKLIFVATANSLQLPTALLSRLKVHLIPHPTEEHASSIVLGLMKDIAAEMGLDPALLPHPPSELVQSMRGNIRQMRAALWRYLHDWASEHLARDRLH